MNGKGDKSRIRDYKSFYNNYENIEWRKKGTYCCNCNGPIDPQQVKRVPHIFNIYPDGQVEHKNCNFN